MPVRLILLLSLAVSPLYAEIKESDISNPDGSAKVLWKDMSEEQKTFVLERQRAYSEYTIANQGKKFSKLKDIPKFMRPRKQIDQHGVYFSTESVAAAYEDLGDLDTAVSLAKADYEANPDRSHGPYKLRRLIGMLSDAGRHKEALQLYQKYLKELLPSYSEKDFETKKHVPDNPTYNAAMVDWEKLKKRANDPGRQPLTPEAEPAVRMHRAFHSKDKRQRLEALEYYSRNRVRFMLEKAKNNDDPDVKQRAVESLKALGGR